MILETGRFGQIAIGDDHKITIPRGLLGFTEYREFCFIDPGDDTLILWLQSLENKELAFPVLEPKVFYPQYVVNLSGTEMRELKLKTVKSATVFSILTIPQDVTQMTANIKAPLVINLEKKLGRQVVLQENDYNIKHPMFLQLKTHLITIQSSKTQQRNSAPQLVNPQHLSASDNLKSLSIDLD